MSVSTDGLHSGTQTIGYGRSPLLLGGAASSTDLRRTANQADILEPLSENGYRPPGLEVPLVLESAHTETKTTVPISIPNQKSRLGDNLLDGGTIRLINLQKSIVCLKDDWNIAQMISEIGQKQLMSAVPSERGTPFSQGMVERLPEIGVDNSNDYGDPRSVEGLQLQYNWGTPVYPYQTSKPNDNPTVIQPQRTSGSGALLSGQRGPVPYGMSAAPQGTGNPVSSEGVRSQQYHTARMADATPMSAPQTNTYFAGPNDPSMIFDTQTQPIVQGPLPPGNQLRGDPCGFSVSQIAPGPPDFRMGQEAAYKMNTVPQVAMD